MLVEGKFDIEAEADPEVAGQKYDWSFEGRGDGKFDPDPSEDGKTEFVAKGITSSGSKSFVKVKYGEAEGSKEAKITRLDRAFSREESLMIQSKPFLRGKRTLHTLFNHTYKYFLYDQYDKPITDSEKGGVEPMIKETFSKPPYSPFLRINNALKAELSAREALGWEPPKGENQFDDWIHLSNIDEDDFRPVAMEEFFHAIKNNGKVFHVKKHNWHGSVSKTNEVILTNNNWQGVFKNVKRDWVGWWNHRKEIISFNIETTYTVEYP